MIFTLLESLYCRVSSILINPPSMKSRRDVAFRSYIGPDVADHAKTSSRRRNWYVYETDVFEPSLQRVIGSK